jgi:gliding motility-associated-like protein
MNRVWLITLFLLFVLLQSNIAAHECNSCRSVVFKQNKNQWHSNVLFKADLPFAALFLEDNGFSFAKGDEKELMFLRHDNHRQHDFKPDLPEVLHFHAVKATFVGSNTNALKEGGEKQEEYFNYFIGNDKSKWASKVNGFHQVLYKDIYAGIDLRVYSSKGTPKFDWIVKASTAKPKSSIPIKIKYEGASKLLLHDGAFVVQTTVGDVIEEKPFAYQIIEGKKVEVLCSFVLSENIVSFHLPNSYNSDYDLVIDPALLFSTYSGSTADNFGYTATFDSKENTYAAGSVFGIGYPTTPGAYQTTWAGGSGAGLPGTDIAITKYNSTGTQREYSTFLGGKSDELPHSLIVNTNDELFVFGTSSSDNFPVTAGAFQTVYQGGPDPGAFTGLGVHYVFGSDIVISRFSADGTQLLASTYVGGTDNDGLNTSMPNNFLRHNYADEVRGEIDIDKEDNIYLATCTRSQDFPVTQGSFQNAAGGGLDGIIIKMNNNLSTMVWCSYFGGEDDDAIYSLAFDKNDDLLVSGGTRSQATLPISQTGVLQWQYNGGSSDGFVGIVDKSGVSVKAATYWGSNSYDQIYFVETDRADNVYVVGQTSTTSNFFIQNAAYNNPNSGLFITKMTHGLDTVIWSTTIGSGNGRPNISPTAFLVDLCAKVYLTGWGANVGGTTVLSTQGMPVTTDAYSQTTDNNDIYMMVLNDDASALAYGTFFGSPSAADHVDGGTSRYSKKGILYQSVCAGCGGVNDFPTTPGAVSTTNNSPNCNNGVYKFDFTIKNVLADFDVPEIPCQIPFSGTFTNKSTVVGNADFVWMFSDGVTSTDSNFTRVFSQPGLYTITLIAIDTASCNGTDSIEKKILILSNTVDSTTLPTRTICKTEITQIGVSPGQFGNVTYAWAPHPSLNELNVPNPFVSPDSTTTYTLYVSKGACTDTLKQTVVVFSDAVDVAASVATCAGDTVQLLATTKQPGQTLAFEWLPAALIISGQGTASPIVSPTRDTTFTVRVTNQLGCTFSGSVDVDVKSLLPSLEAIATPYDIAYGDTSQLSITTQGVASVAWRSDETLSDTSIFTPVAYPLETTVYYVLATDTNGCFASDTVIVRVFKTPCATGGVFLPNAFTPNGDGKNDVLYVRGIRITEVFLAIYDRWGQLMFETSDIKKGWDGTYGGKLLDAGVFGYYLKAVCEEGEVVSKEGNITLLR